MIQKKSENERDKMKEWIVTILLRGVLGVLLIHFMNIACMQYGYATVVGVNSYTIPVVSILGIPGIGLLYVLKMFW